MKTMELKRFNSRTLLKRVKENVSQKEKSEMIAILSDRGVKIPDYLKSAESKAVKIDVSSVNKRFRTKEEIAQEIGKMIDELLNENKSRFIDRAIELLKENDEVESNIAPHKPRKVFEFVKQSTENPNLKVGDRVKFKVSHMDNKYPKKVLEGFVSRIFMNNIVKKEFVRILTEYGYFNKRTNSVQIL